MTRIGFARGGSDGGEDRSSLTVGRFFWEAGTRGEGAPDGKRQPQRAQWNLSESLLSNSSSCADANIRGWAKEVEAQCRGEEEKVNVCWFFALFTSLTSEPVSRCLRSGCACLCGKREFGRWDLLSWRSNRSASRSTGAKDSQRFSPARPQFESTKLQPCRGGGLCFRVFLGPIPLLDPKMCT